jgi:arylformamidase
MIRDISPPIGPAIVTWPGDTRFCQQRHFAIGADCPVNVSRITLSTHTGAHADAPLHYRPDGAPAGDLDLQAFLGPCRVIDVRQATGLVHPHHVLAALEGAPPRILLRTYEQSPAEWDPQFTAIAVDTVEILAARQVVLVGTDAPSIDPATAKQLQAHQAACRGGIAILEGLLLTHIPAGDYELLALPLRLAELDAAPVRAVLRDLPCRP